MSDTPPPPPVPAPVPGLPPDVLDTTEAGPRVIRGSATRVGGHVAGIALAAVATAFLLRELGPEDAGRYITVITLAGLGAGLADAGLSLIGLREYAVRPADERDLFLRNIVTLRLALTSAGMVGALAYAVLAGFGATLVAGTAIVAVGLLLATVQHGVGTALAAELRLGWLTTAEVLRQLVGTCVIIALVVAGAQLQTYFAAPTLGALAALVLTLAVIRSTTVLRPAWTGPLLRELLRDALPYAAASAAAVLYLRIGVLLVERAASPAQTGYYGASFRVVEALSAIPGLAVLTAFPLLARAARNDAARFGYAIQRTFDAALLLGAGVGVVLGVGAPVAIAILGGDSLEPAAAVLRIHAVTLTLGFASTALGFALLSLRATRAILAQALCALLTLVVATLALTDLDGARGAAIASVLAELVLAAWGVVALRRQGTALDLTQVLRVGVAAGLAVLPAFVLPALPAMLLAGLIYIGVAYALRAVPVELVAELRRRRLPDGDGEP